MKAHLRPAVDLVTIMGPVYEHSTAEGRHEILVNAFHNLPHADFQSRAVVWARIMLDLHESLPEHGLTLIRIEGQDQFGYPRKAIGLPNGTGDDLELNNLLQLVSHGDYILNTDSEGQRHLWYRNSNTPVTLDSLCNADSELSGVLQAISFITTYDLARSHHDVA